ncbi:hypothetical protein [Planotetraspora kaengkrachanensis]|uniref:DUF916 domain-containing protein n=1 Tax=Planotetraspora kaengkrachanensis TaxID=575193 RepID=A0A8J3PTS9_9ACTN|nr:hypothetical protein [Planotetraspora kaengkrachanensis]GIG80895.1 hypothetical protein Pka01_40220 [Planotetraspora kaengkrachanensis]
MAVLLSALFMGPYGGAAPAALASAGTAHSAVSRFDPGAPGEGLGVRLVDAPVVRRKDPRARTGVVDHLNPGTTIRRRLEVSNTTAEPLHVSLYAAAASIEGRTFTFAPERTPNELSTWTTVEPREIDLAPGHKRIAWFTVDVPQDAWRGERYAVMWAQTAIMPDKVHNVGLASRVGVRMYLDIGPGGEPPSDMSIEKFTPERDATGQPRLVAEVRNTGGRALELSGALSLSEGPGGLRAGPYPATLGVALKPGDVGQVVVVLDPRLPNGPWKADLVIQSGLVKRTVSATVVFPDAGVGQSVLFGGNRLLLISLLLALILVIATGVYLLRRRRRQANPGMA